MPIDTTNNNVRDAMLYGATNGAIARVPVTNGAQATRRNPNSGMSAGDYWQDRHLPSGMSPADRAANPRASYFTPSFKGPVVLKTATGVIVTLGSTKSGNDSLGHNTSIKGGFTVDGSMPREMAWEMEFRQGPAGVLTGKVRNCDGKEVAVAIYLTKDWQSGKVTLERAYVNSEVCSVEKGT